MRTEMTGFVVSLMNGPGIQPEVNRNDDFKLENIYERNLFWRFELKLYAFELNRLGIEIWASNK